MKTIDYKIPILIGPDNNIDIDITKFETVINWNEVNVLLDSEITVLFSKEVIYSEYLLALVTLLTRHPKLYIVGFDTLPEEELIIIRRLLYNNKLRSLKTIHIAIPTYNRPTELLQLIKNIEEYNTQHIIEIYIYDDCSTEDYTSVLEYLDNSDLTYFYKRNEVNYGKEKYSLVYNNIMSDAKKSNADYFIQTADDMLLVSNFFNRAINLLEITKEEILNILITHHHLKVYKKKKINIINKNDIHLYKAGLDGAYICKKSFYEAVNFKIDLVNPRRWLNNPLNGSGTGLQFKKKYNKPIYQLTNSLLIHIGDTSTLNPILRKTEIMTSVLNKQIDIDIFNTYRYNNKRIIFVGPSPDLIDTNNKLGKWIDDFDIVIRTNGSYPVTNTEYYGSKTNIVVLNKPFQNAAEFNKTIYENITVFDIGSFYNNNNKNNYIFNDIQYFDSNIISDIQNRICVEELQPFSLMFIIEQFLKYKPKEIVIVGITNYATKQHYLPNYLPSNINESDIKKRQEQFHKHSIEHQRKYILSLTENNLITLHDTVKTYFK